MESAASYVALVAVLLSCAVYLLIARFDSRHLRSAGDFFLYRRRLSAEQTFGTFYASGMSLATVFIAFMQLAPVFGVSLFWAALFYAAGHVVLWFLIPRIRSFSPTGSTLHGFLGETYNHDRLRTVASVCTAIGFLGIFSTELIVGSNLVRALLPGAGAYLPTLLFLCVVVIAYSILGGFRTVVRTDLVQAIAVIAFCVLMVFIAFQFGRPEAGEPLIKDGLLDNWALAPIGAVTPSLVMLMMLNFFLINVPFPLIDMSAWQRVIAARDIASCRRGVMFAAGMFLITWVSILFAGLALSETSTADSTGGITTVLLRFGASNGWFPLVLASLGFAALIAAMLSTADTFLIAAGQTISMDMTDRRFFDSHPIEEAESDDSSSIPMDPEHEQVVARARRHMAILAGVSLILCVGLQRLGFRVADLVFAVYGSALALVPTVLCALFLRSRLSLARVAPWAVLSVSVGIVGGWLYGIISVAAPAGSFLHRVVKWWILPDAPSAYNAPTIAFGLSFVILLIGLIVGSRRATS